MKNKLSILLICCLIGFSINAQEYFPKGAIWHYSNVIYNFPVNYNYTTIESKGDSIFNNDTLTYLNGYVSCGTGYNELVKQVGQKVYKLNKCDSSFSLLYDFNASVGDTLTFFPDLCFNMDSAQIVIDSIKPININGNILNHFFFSQLPPISYWAMSYYAVGEYIEGIGNLHSFYPYYGPCDPWGGLLRCYNDSLIGGFKANNFTGSCDTTYVGIEENILNQSTSIFPNPTFDRIYIEADNIIIGTEIYSLSGQRILATKNKEIDLFSFSKGIYLLKIYFEKGIVYRKVVKK